MRIIIILTAFLALSFPARAQVAAIPTINISSNDVVQSSISVAYSMSGSINSVAVRVNFAFTETGSKRLEEFYRTNAVDEDVRWQIGSFVQTSKLDDPKSFARQGFGPLPVKDAKSVSEKS